MSAAFFSSHIIQDSCKNSFVDRPLPFVKPEIIELQRVLPTGYAMNNRDYEGDIFPLLTQRRNRAVSEVIAVL